MIVDPDDIDAMLAYAANRHMVWIRLIHTKGRAYADHVQRLVAPIIAARMKSNAYDDDDIPF